MYLVSFTPSPSPSSSGTATADSIGMVRHLWDDAVTLLHAAILNQKHAQSSSSTPSSSLMALLDSTRNLPPVAARFAQLKKAASRHKAYPVLEVLCSLENDLGGVLDAYLHDEYRAPQVFTVIRHLLIEAQDNDDDNDDDNNDDDDNNNNSQNEIIAETSDTTDGPEGEGIKRLVLDRLHALITLDSGATSSLIVDHFGDEHEAVVSSLEPYPSLLFIYLGALLEPETSEEDEDESSMARGGAGLNVIVVQPGALGENHQHAAVVRQQLQEQRAVLAQRRNNHVASSRVGAPSKARRGGGRASESAFLASLQEKYVTLMCAYDPDSVVHFVKRHDAYRLDVVLAVTQEYGLVDATAYLLERTGDSAGAIDLIMKDFASSLEARDVESLERLFGLAISVCQRTTEREDDTPESRELWFALLDKTLDVDDENGPETQDVLHKLMRTVLNGMSGSVSLPSLLSKILDDHGERQYGEFKDVILGILSTYRYETVLLKTTNHILGDDCFSYIQNLRATLEAPFAGGRTMCGVCQEPLQTDDPSAVIKVFKCGHEVHSACGLGANACPVCYPAERAAHASSSTARGSRRRRAARPQQEEDDGGVAEYKKRLSKYAKASASRSPLEIRRIEDVVDNGKFVSTRNLQLRPANAPRRKRTDIRKRVPGALGAPMYLAGISVE